MRNRGGRGLKEQRIAVRRRSRRLMRIPSCYPHRADARPRSPDPGRATSPRTQGVPQLQAMYRDRPTHSEVLCQLPSVWPFWSGGTLENDRHGEYLRLFRARRDRSYNAGDDPIQHVEGVGESAFEPVGTSVPCQAQSLNLERTLVPAAYAPPVPSHQTGQTRSDRGIAASP